MDNKLQNYWSEAVVDSYNTIEDRATLILNFNFDVFDWYRLYIEYIVGYALWVKRESSKMKSIQILFDIRGQNVNLDQLETFKKDLGRRLSLIETFNSEISFKS